MPRTISGNGPWTVSNAGGFPWLPVSAAVGAVAVVVIYRTEVLRVLHDVLLAAEIALGGVTVAGTVAGALVWRWRRARRQGPVCRCAVTGTDHCPVHGAETGLTPVDAQEIGLDTVRAGWPFTRTDGSAIELPERAQSRWN
jgi:hypothetical protein